MSDKFNQNDDSIRPGEPSPGEPSPEQIIDAKIKRAFADVPVPAGLESRILAALAAAPTSADSSISIGEDAAADKPEPLEASPTSPSPSLRRRWYAAHWYLSASAVFVAASLLLALFIQWNAAPGLTGSFVVQTAMDAFDAHQPGRLLGKDWPAAVNDFQPSTDVNLSRCTSVRWQKLDFLGSTAVLYTFTAPGGAAAQLYVQKLSGQIEDLPDAPPGKPQCNTGGRRASAWQADGYLYVFVVHGNTKTYRSLLVPGGPLT